MPEPEIEVPEVTQDSVDQILSDADAAQNSFLQQASDEFDRREGKPARQAASKPATTAKPASTTSTPEAKPVVQPGTEKGKIPGPPVAAPAETPQPAKEGGEQGTSLEYPGKGRTTKDHWDRMAALRVAAETKAKELETRLTEISKKTAQTGELQPEVKTRIEELQRANDELLQRLEAVAVERSPRFEAAFRPRVDAAVALAKAAVGPDKADRVAQLLSMPDTEFRNQQLEEIAGELSGIRLGKFTNAIGEIDRVNEERTLAAGNSRNLFKQWTAEEQQRVEQSREQRKQSLTKTLDSEIQEWQKSVDVLRPKENDTTGHNEAVTQRLETAKSIFLGGLPMQDLARASLWAAIGPDLANQAASQQKRIAELETEIAGLRGAQPGTASDAGSAATETSDEPDENLSYSDAIAHSVVKAGLLR